MKYVVIALLTAIVSIGIEWLNAKAQPREIRENSGLLSPSRIFMWFTLLFGNLMTWLGVVMVISGEDLIWAIPAIMMSLSFIYASALGLLKIHDVIWTDQYIEGPNRVFGIVLGWSRTRINWDDLTRYDSNWAEYLYVETAEGDRIYWGIWYPGFSKLGDLIYERTS